MQQINQTKFIILIVILPLLLCGCYDRFELDNLAYVVAIGADIGSGENLDITYQIAIPVKITGESSETGTSTYTTYTVSAPSLSLANTLVNTKVSKRINLSHVKLIVYSKEMAKSDLSGHVNVFISDSNIRPRAGIAICEGTAKEFLKNIFPKLEASPSRYYELLFSAYNYTTQAVPSQLIDLYTAFQSIDRNAYATYVKLSSGEEKEAELAGIAIFDETRLIETVEDKEFLLAHSLLTNNLKQTSYIIPDFNRDDRVISVRLIQNSEPKITVSLSGDSPHIKCNIRLETHLISSGSDINFYDKNNEQRLKKELDKNIEETINTFFDKTIHEYQVDIAAIGKSAKQNFATWQEFEDYHWLSKYRNATYDVDIDNKLNISQIISHIIPNASK
ncbi:MAG: Ger(x)C family spore germination protein [Clostridia bacterium]|nr:Ger(x)C family spore germination protein [Clostridia bacterium]